MHPVLHVLAPADVGGMESVVRLLTAELVSAGTPVHAHVITVPGHVAPLASVLEASGVGVHVTEVPGRQYGLERQRTRDLCSRLGIRVVHTHGYRPDVIDAPAVRAGGLPVVSTVHGFTGGGWKNAVYEWLQVRSLRRMDRVLAVSRPLVDLLTRKGVPAAAVRLVPNAFAASAPPLERREARAALGLAGDGPTVGWIGRMSREKGPDVAVAAAGLAGASGPEWVMVGDGPEREACEVAAARDSLPVRFAGMVPDAGRLVRAFDAVVLSSRTEGTPIVALEAMAAGVPVVATSVGGVPVLLGDRAGVLVPAEDPGALARAVADLLADPAAMGAVVERAHRRLDTRYAVPSWIEAHQALYAEVASARSPG